MSVTSALRIQRAINARRAERSSGAVITTVAADFLHGGAPCFARMFDQRGTMVSAIQRRQDELWEAFRRRARVEAGKAGGGDPCSLAGFLRATRAKRTASAFRPAEGGQRRAASRRGRPARGGAASVADRGARSYPWAPARRIGVRSALGQATILITLAVDAALSGKRVGVFAPTRTLCRRS